MKQITEETQVLCQRCYGRGQESDITTTAGYSTCTHCRGVGYIVTSRTVRTESESEPSLRTVRVWQG